MRRFLLTLLSLTLLASACSSEPEIPTAGESPTTSTPDRNDDGEVVIEIDGDDVVLTSALSGFGDCGALLEHLRTEAADRVTAWGLQGGGWFGVPEPMIARLETDDMAVEESAEMSESASASASAASGDATADSAAAVEGVDFSGTNVQEVGVDEADIIKTDGERIYLVAARQLVVVDVDDREVIGAVDLPQSWNTEL
ncbi:MAG: beta-propeller domain-containing protein, partial [Actinomycetota bacterium]